MVLRQVSTVFVPRFVHSPFLLWSCTSGSPEEKHRPLDQHNLDSIKGLSLETQAFISDCSSSFVHQGSDTRTRQPTYLQQQLVFGDSLDGFDQEVTDGQPGLDVLLDSLEDTEPLFSIILLGEKPSKNYEIFAKRRQKLTSKYVSYSATMNSDLGLF